MSVLRSLIVAFAMYSKFPMPRVNWNKANMAYALCWFPLVGVVIGIFLFAWFYLADFFSIGTQLSAVVTALIPVAVTGGIHLDGFADTADALASHAAKEQKLIIMKDPNSGAFAVISLCVYFLLYYAALCELTFTVALCFIPVLSRALTGFAAVSYKNARKDGFLVAFTEAANGIATRIICVLWGAAAIAVMVGISTETGIAVSVAALLTFIYYRYMSYREFGGITGDLSGWFLQICELMCVLAMTTVRIFLR